MTPPSSSPAPKTPSPAASFVSGQFCSVDLAASDMDAAAAFYRSLFDWSAEPQDAGGGPPYAFFVLDGDVVAGLGELSDERRADGAPPSWGSYVQTDDIQTLTERAAALGGTVLVPPMPIPRFGWVAFLQDPTGAHLGLWQSGEFRGAERVGGPGSFCWNELVTPDLEAAQAFYGPLFDWTFTEHPESSEPYVVIHTGSAEASTEVGGMLQMTDDWGDAPPHWAVYFAVEDADASANRLQALGGRVLHGPFDLSVGRMAAVADPQGATFNLIALTRG